MIYGEKFRFTYCSFSGKNIKQKENTLEKYPKIYSSNPEAEDLHQAMMNILRIKP